MSTNQFNSTFGGIIKAVLSLTLVLSLVMSGMSGLTSRPEGNREQAWNVIFMIGDGMGENHLEWAKQLTGKELAMETMTYRGQSETASASASVTDSAAGGTALACGVRTINGYIGVYNVSPLKTMGYPQNLTELAISLHKMTGIVTTDSTAGATPAAFSAHSSSRSNTEDITNQQVASGINLIWGKTSGYASREAVEKAGKVYIDNYTDLKALTPDDMSFAQFGSDMWAESVITGDTPTLSQMTSAAIDLLKGAENGFFLMVEGAHIDKHSHSNRENDMASALIEFDGAIQIALDFAKENGNTLVIVTADHETGAIKLNSDGTYSYTQTSHSGANVPLLVYGCNDFIENGEVVKNMDIPVLVSLVWGRNGAFPKRITD